MSFLAVSVTSVGDGRISVSEWVGFIVHINILFDSFPRRVFPVSHLHWYRWQPNKNNPEIEHTNNTAQKVAIDNGTIDTLRKKTSLDRAWFSWLKWHLAVKRSGSILTTLELAQGDWRSWTRDSSVKVTLGTEPWFVLWKVGEKIRSWISTNSRTFMTDHK